MSTELFYLIPNFLEYAKDYRGLSDNVIAHYYYNLKLFREYIAYNKGPNTKVEEITTNDVLKYIQTKKMTKIAKGKFKGQYPRINTICNIRNSIHSFFKRCRITDLQCLNPEGIPKIKKEYSRLNYLEEDEFKILLDCPKAIHNNKLAILRNELLLEVPYYTGLRRSEILQLKFEDFKSSSKQIEIKGKGGRIGTILFPDLLAQKIDKFYKKLDKECKKRKLPTPKEIFVGLDNKNFGNVITPKSVGNIMITYNKFCQKNNLLDKDFSIHMLRHSFGTMMMKKGIDIRIAQILMRHKNITETQRYTHVRDELLHQEYKKFIS